MDPLSTLLSWQFLLFCLAVSAVIFPIRTVVDYVLKSMNKSSSIWRDVILPILPVIVGTLMGWKLTTFPYPDGVSSVDFRLVFGLVAGSLSGVVYRMIKAMVFNRVATNFPALLPQVQNVLGAPPPPPVSPTVVSTTTTVVSSNQQQ
jgi:hypothetical protein